MTNFGAQRTGGAVPSHHARPRSEFVEQMVAEVADEGVVMYTGKVVEQADVFSLFKSPKHPYTQGLLESIPNIDKELKDGEQRERLHAIQGNVPDLLDLPKGCSFAARCPQVEERCREAVPDLVSVGEAHSARCVLYPSGQENV